MSRISRHFVNVALLLIAVSGQFNLIEFIQLLAVNKSIWEAIIRLAGIVRLLCYYLLINGVHNIGGLGLSVKALLVPALWLISGHPFIVCDVFKATYDSAPSNNIFGRLWHVFSAEETRAFIAVVGLTVVRLLMQWGTFRYFLKAHEGPDSVNSKKNNCTVIIPTADTLRHRVEECLVSSLLNEVREVIVVTSRGELPETESLMDKFRTRFPKTTIRVIGTEGTGKFDMISEGIRFVETDIVVLVDPNVFWPYRFLNRLLISFNNNVGFAMIHQRVRRFRLPFIEVSPRVTSTQLEPKIGLSSGEHAARAIACRKSLLQHPDFMASFRRAQLVGSASYDEELAARFLERWALEKGYYAAKGYSGHNAFEPPASTMPESAIWTHRLFACIRYVRQAVRMRFGKLLVDATSWGNLPSPAHSSHAPAFLIAAFVIDALIVMLLVYIPQPVSFKIRVLVGMMAGFEIEEKARSDFKGKMPSLGMMLYFVFVWFHGLVKRWAAIYLFLNIFGETAMSMENKPPMTVVGKRDDMSALSSPSASETDMSNGDLQISSAQSDTAAQGSNDLSALSPRQNVAAYNEAIHRASTVPPRTNDPIERVRNSPSYRPALLPPLPRPRTLAVRLEDSENPQTSLDQTSAAQSPSPRSQPGQESSQSLPNTPSEGSHLREDISEAIQDDSAQSSPSSEHERQSLSRSPSPQPQTRQVSPEHIVQSLPDPGIQPSRSDRRRRAARKAASYDEEFNPSESDLSSDGSSSAHGSHAGSVAEDRPQFRTPSFTPSRPASRSTTPVPVSGHIPVLPMPSQISPRQTMPADPDSMRETTPQRGVQTASDPSPQLRVPKFTKNVTSPAAASSATLPPAKPKSRRAASKPVVAPPRKARCSKCRRLHDGDCLAE